MGKDRSEERFHEREERRKEHQKHLPTEEEPELPPPVKPIHADDEKTGRNDPCPCGSGKKYKKCCGRK